MFYYSLSPVDDAATMATDGDEILIHDVAKELQLGVAFLSGI